MKPTITSEALSELTVDELSAVAGAAPATMGCRPHVVDGLETILP